MRDEVGNSVLKNGEKETAGDQKGLHGGKRRN